MVYTPSKCVALIFGALCVATTQAAPLSKNPHMNIPNEIPLNADHPAFGGRPSEHMPKVIAPLDKIFDPPSNTTIHPLKETSSSWDIDHLQSFLGDLELNFEALKAYGSKKIQPSPWPGSYWAVYQDSINFKWDGPNSQSASEKYARAFGLNVQSFMNTISSSNGIDGNSGARQCTDDSQCDSLNNGSKCGKRDGHSSGYCIPTWWGICHAWSPAAILESEPSCSVDYNGVTFKPLDIKALVSLFYDGASVPTVFLGTREDGDDASRDQYGRFVVPARRDVGAGLFHIALTNIMGKHGRSFVADMDPGYKVWNQPIRSYNVVHTERMSPVQAAQRFFHVNWYPFNNDARSIAYVETDFSWINELVEDGPLVSNGRVEQATATRRHTYVLELDGNDNIIGGEWVGDSQTYHPDFIWAVTEKPTSGKTDVGLDYSNIKKLLDASAIGNCDITAPSFGRCGSEGSGILKCPTGQYCQPWNPDEYYCRQLDAKCGTQETGTDYWGNDLATVTGLLLPEQCCDQCHATEGCTSYTFINYVTWGDKKPLCYLKSGTPNDKRSNPKAVSATIVRNSCNNKLWDRCGSASSGAECCESGAYCQPWDLRNFQCMPIPKKCGKLYTGVDFYGNDIKTLFGISTEDCCNACATTSGCKAFTYVNDNPGQPACYLKSDSGDRRSNVHVVSGLLN